MRRRYWAALRNSVNKILSTDGMTQNLTLQRPLVGSDGTVTVVLLSLSLFSLSLSISSLYANRLVLMDSRD